MHEASETHCLHHAHAVGEVGLCQPDQTVEIIGQI